MTIPDIPDAAYEAAAQTITHAWMEHLGYTTDEIAMAETGHTPECEFDGESWCCIDENASSLHPGYDELCETAELVMFVLEHEATRSAFVAAGRAQAAADIRRVDVQHIADLQGDTARVGLTVAARIAEGPEAGGETR